MSVPNLDSLYRKTNPKAESSGDCRKIKKPHMQTVLTYQELKYQFQVRMVRDNRIFNGFLLLIKDLRFRSTKKRKPGVLGLRSSFSRVFVFVTPEVLGFPRCKNL